MEEVLHIEYRIYVQHDHKNTIRQVEDMRNYLMNYVYGNHFVREENFLQIASFFSLFFSANDEIKNIYIYMFLINS